MTKWIRHFPVQIALGAFVIYALTLSHGVTVASLPMTAKVAGWDWNPLAGHPLLWLLTLPLRLLPAAWVPAGLNLLSAICAAATLGLLVRSLELVPWFRPLDELPGWSRRLPLVLAAGACGLAYSFWQNATAITGEMAGLLLLAAAIWCLLESRTNKDRRWLFAAAAVWGTGMAENWMMQITLPLFVAGVAWLMGLRFLDWRFILRMAGFGLAGFSIYFLPPLANGLWPGSPLTVGQAYLLSLRETKSVVMGVYRIFWAGDKLLAFVILLFFLAPVVSVLMRTGLESTKHKPALDVAIIWFFRAVRGILLLFCLWLAFDPLLGPRQLMIQRMGLSLPLLTLDYLNALAAGVIAGNLLLIQPGEESGRRRSLSQKWDGWMQRIAPPALSGLLVLVLLGLGARNLPVLTLANRHPLTEFGELGVRSLPSGGGIVVSEFSERLLLFQAAQARVGGKSDWVPLNLQAMASPEYRAQWEWHTGRTLGSTNTQTLAVGEMIRLFIELARTNQIFCLQPSHGMLAEWFDLKPMGAVFEMRRASTNDPFAPPLTADEIAQTEKLWDDLTPNIESLQPAGQPTDSWMLQAVEKPLHLAHAQPVQIDLLREWYAQALNTWGVSLQRNGRLPAAQHRFAQAVALSTNNWIATVNLEGNTNLQAGVEATPLRITELLSQPDFTQKLLMSEARLGTVDEADCCLNLAEAFARVGQLRQAMQQADHARRLAPGVPRAALALASLYARSGLMDRAMALTETLRDQSSNALDRVGFEVQLALIEADIWMAKTNRTRATATLQATVQKHPDDIRVLNRIAVSYVNFRDFTNAEQLTRHVLDQDSNNIPALLTQSGILLQTERSAAAIPVLNHVLSLTNIADARFYRVIAYMQTQDYDAARQECVEIGKAFPNGYLGEYGLAKIAELQHDTKQAIHYLNICLSNAPANSALKRDLQQRLEMLQKPASP